MALVRDTYKFVKFSKQRIDQHCGYDSVTFLAKAFVDSRLSNRLSRKFHLPFGMKYKRAFEIIDFACSKDLIEVLPGGMGQVIRIKSPGNELIDKTFLLLPLDRWEFLYANRPSLTKITLALLAAGTAIAIALIKWYNTPHLDL